MGPNPLQKFRLAMSGRLEPEREEKSPPKRNPPQVVPAARKLWHPKARIRNHEVEATEVREYYDPNKGWQVEERPHQAYTNVPSKLRGGKIKKTGIYRLHKGERVVPLSTLRRAK